LHFLSVKLNEKVSGNINAYSAVSPLAKSIDDMEVSEDFQKILDEFNDFRDSNEMTLTAKQLMADFPSIDYSTIDIKYLLNSPLEAIGGTYILAVNPPGNKTANLKGPDYRAIYNSIKSNSNLEEAPLEYAKYLITVSYKYNKTNWRVGMDKPKVSWQVWYYITGTLIIYDRVTGEQVSKLSFSSPKKPTKNTMYYCYDSESCLAAIKEDSTPNINKASSSFFTDFKQAIAALH